MTYSSRPKIQVNLILGCSAVPEQWYLNYSGKVHLHKTPDNVQGENIVALETSIPIWAGGILSSNPARSYDIVHNLVSSFWPRFSISIASQQDAELVTAGYGRVVLEKILVFAKPNSKQHSSQLFVLSGRQDDAVITQYGVHTLTLSVLKSKKPFRVTMVGITVDLTIYLLSKHVYKECRFMDCKTLPSSCNVFGIHWMQNEAIHALDIWTSCCKYCWQTCTQHLVNSWALFGSWCVGVDGPPCSAQLSAPNDQWS